MQSRTYCSWNIRNRKHSQSTYSQVFPHPFSHFYSVNQNLSRLFGVLLLGAEFKIKAILKNVPFLGSFLGRGIFNI